MNAAGKYADPGRWRHEIAKSDLAPSTRHVAHAFALFLPKGHKSSFVGTRKLATATGHARNTVLKAIAELRDGGWIIEEEATRGGKVNRYPTMPLSGSLTEPVSGATTAPLSGSEGGSTTDKGGALTDESGSMADTSGSVTAPYLKDNSELTQRRTPAAPPRCSCQKTGCGQKVQHAKEYQRDPAAFLTKHLGASMEMPNAS